MSAMDLQNIMVLSIFLSSCLGKELPSFIHVCHRSDLELENCFVKAVEDIRPYLVTGVPEYNIPSVEPLIIKDLIKEETSGITLITSDVIAYGGGNFNVESFKADINRITFTADVGLPELRIEAHYEVHGMIVVLQIKGKGNFFANITNCRANAVLQAELYNKDGNAYLRFVSNKMKIRIGGGQVRLDNLFGGQKLLSDVVNDTVNKNLHIFLKKLMPSTERALAAEILNISNKIVEPFTFDQLFPA